MAAQGRPLALPSCLSIAAGLSNTLITCNHPTTPIHGNLDQPMPSQVTYHVLELPGSSSRIARLLTDFDIHLQVTQSPLDT